VFWTFLNSRAIARVHLSVPGVSAEHGGTLERVACKDNRSLLLSFLTFQVDQNEYCEARKRRSLNVHCLRFIKITVNGEGVYERLRKCSLFSRCQSSVWECDGSTGKDGVG
jgi:hypothetical protein